MIEYNPEKKEGTSLSGDAEACVVGIGGAGANVLDRIALENMVEIELVSMNTDIRALTNAVSSRKVQLGAEITRGLGAGGDPELGLEAARSAEQAIREVLEGRDMVFLCVGLGGGTGSGAAPLVARIAREMGSFVVVFATMPFSFEGRRRLEQARGALAELEQASDALIVFENDSMGQLVVSKSGVQEAFAAADQMIGHSVRAVTTLVTQPGLIRIGMDDLMTALRNADSRCLFGYGSARGKNRAQEALKRAMKSPLLDGGKMIDRAGSVLVHITGGESMTLYEVELLMKELARRAGEQANVLFGVGVDPKLGESMSVTVISSISSCAAGDGELESAVTVEEDQERQPEEHQDEQSEEVAEAFTGQQDDAGTSDPAIETHTGTSAEATEVETTAGDTASAGRLDDGPQGQVEMDLLCEDRSQQEAGGWSEEQDDRVEAAADTATVTESGEDPQVAREEAGATDEATEEGPDPGGKERPGGLGINLLPRVFGRGKGKAKGSDDTAQSDELVSGGELEVDAASSGSAEEDHTGMEKTEKTSVIASFVDRSKRQDDEGPAKTAEPAALAGAEELEQVAGDADGASESGEGLHEAGGGSELVDQGALALDEGKAGRFVKGEPTIVDGEDLDVPTFLRRKNSS